MEKVFVAQRLAKKLSQAETKMDAAISETAELLAEVVQASQKLGVSMSLAEGTQTKLLETLKALSEARSAMVGAHSELYEAKLRVGIRTRLVFETTPNAHADDAVEMADEDARQAV